jgi:methionyl-tRNA formyltransferase
MRIIFCGTPAFAVPSLRRLLAEPGIEVCAVVTQPDRPRGRGQQFSPSPVKEAAASAGISTFQPDKLRTEEVRDFFMGRAPDAVVIIAYGRIVPGGLLTLPRLGWINLHASLLPRYRGAAPIQWAVSNGETHTGLTTMRINAGLDTGPILDRVEMEIGRDETSTELSARMAEAGAPLIVSTLQKLERGEIVSRPQDNSAATVAPPLKKEDGRINWALPAAQIYNRIRGMQPWPGAYSTFRGEICHIWGRPADLTPPSIAAAGALEQVSGEWLAACGGGSRLRLEFVQMQGRKRVTAKEFANGARLQGGELFE